MVDDLGPTLVVVSAIFIGMTTVAVALRFWVRIKMQKRFGLDDWLLVTGLVCPFSFHHG
jgi:hypothetical protein